MKAGERKVYVTIPYTEIGKNGELMRAMNGLEMCAGDDVDHAITLRRHSILTKRFVREHPDHTEKELVNFVIKLVTEG